MKVAISIGCSVLGFALIGFSFWIYRGRWWVRRMQQSMSLRIYLSNVDTVWFALRPAGAALLFLALYSVLGVGPLGQAAFWLSIALALVAVALIFWQPDSIKPPWARQ